MVPKVNLVQVVPTEVMQGRTPTPLLRVHQGSLVEQGRRGILAIREFKVQRVLLAQRGNLVLPGLRVLVAYLAQLERQDRRAHKVPLDRKAGAEILEQMARWAQRVRLVQSVQRVHLARWAQQVHLVQRVQQAHLAQVVPRVP